MLDNPTLLAAIERTLNGDIGKDEIIELMNKVPSGSQKKLMADILHSMYHFVSDSDIRSLDKEYDSLQRKELKEFIKIINEKD